MFLVFVGGEARVCLSVLNRRRLSLVDPMLSDIRSSAWTSVGNKRSKWECLRW